MCVKTAPMTHILFVFLLAIQSLWAVTPEVQSLIDMETKANAVAVRSNESVDMPHLEIPLRLLDRNFERNVDLQILKSLVFTKNGEKYVRWVINPEDTKWHQEVIRFLRANGVDTTIHSHFKGYMTASRSYIVEDPMTKAQFSIKTSTDKTGGFWSDKKQHYQDAFDIRNVSDYVKERERLIGFENVVVMYEPIVFGIKDVDQSIVVRELAGLPKGGKYYVPGFSALHSELGAAIAKRNGSDSPYMFWTTHYLQAMARASVEFMAKTGIWLDSPHSQNFLVELDANMKPTGRIVIRDLGDVYLAEPMIKAFGGNFLKTFSEQDSIRRANFDVSFGPLHDNNPPEWMSFPQYKSWASLYEGFVNAEIQRQLGITPGSITMEHTKYKYKKEFTYFQNSFSMKSEAWKAYVDKNSLAKISCTRTYAN